MSSTFKVLFYARKNFRNKHNQSPVMIRVTINGKMCQFSAKVNVDPDRWDAQLGRMKGKTTETEKVNALLDGMRNMLMNYYQLAEKQHGHATPEMVRNYFLGKATSQDSMLELFSKVLERLNKLVECQKKSPKTVEKYERTYKRLESFLKEERKVNDIMVRLIDFDFVVDFETYLLSTWKYGHNTTSKYMQIFRSIILNAKNNGIISVDPFHNYTITFKPVDIGYLTEEELQVMMKKVFTIPRLEHVRDVFVFCCYTAVAQTALYRTAKWLCASHYE